MSAELFEKATRKKLRFETTKGTLTTEDLWDMPLVTLNTLAKFLNKRVKEVEEEDFLKETSTKDDLTVLKFNTVIHVLTIKKQEKEARLSAAANKDTKDKLVSALAKKREEALVNMSEEDLQKSIEAL